MNNFRSDPFTLRNEIQWTETAGRCLPGFVGLREFGAAGAVSFPSVIDDSVHRGSVLNGKNKLIGTESPPSHRTPTRTDNALAASGRSLLPLFKVGGGWLPTSMNFRNSHWDVPVAYPEVKSQIFS